MAESALEWRAMIRRAKAEAQGTTEDEGEEDEGGDVEPVVLEPSCAVDPPKGAIAALVKRLQAQHWQVCVTRSLAFIPATLFKNDSKEDAKDKHLKGEVRFAEHNLEVYVVIGVKWAGRTAFVAEVTYKRKGEGSLSMFAARTFDPILGMEYRPMVRTPRPQTPLEKAEGITPPIGLNQWLNIVCPTESNDREEIA